MNTTARKASTFFAIALTASIGAVVATGGFGTAEAKPEIVKLERVVITGKRAEATPVARIEQLPRVVIEGRRADVQVAGAKTRSADVS